MVTKNGYLLILVDRVQATLKLPEGDQRSPDVGMLEFKRFPNIKDENLFFPVETLLQFLDGDGGHDVVSHALLVLNQLGILANIHH